jgi:predicted O-methyltransferase YrrM
MTEPWDQPQAQAEYRDALASGRPYFGAVCQADQGHIHFRCFPAVVEAVRRTRRDAGPLSILEIGSWAGASLVAWDRAAQGNVMLYAVDTWQPYIDEQNSYCDMMRRVAESGEIRRLFDHNMRVCGLEPRLTVHCGISRDILAQLAPGFDIIYIDGDHRYPAVRGDIVMSMPLIRDGGILCGDDLDSQVWQLPADEHQEVLARYTDAGVTRSGISYHAGVAQAVHDFFGPVTTHGGRFWAVQKHPALQSWCDPGLET